MASESVGHVQKAMPTRLSVSVIVPVHNGGENFRLCIRRLAEADPRPDEIIVVADGDADGSWREAEAIHARVLRFPIAGGPARARNVGARHASGQILFFVDADVMAPLNVVQQVVDEFRDEPKLAALFGSYDDEPGAPNFLSQYKNLLHHYVHQTSAEEASTFWGACGAVRRDVFLDLGGFDERYRYPSIEDIELGYRMRRAGHRIRLCKDLQVKHLKRWGVVSLLESDFLRRALPWTELILRDKWLTSDLNLRFSHRLSALLTVGLLGSFICVLWKVEFLGVSVLLALCLLALNARLYLFFRRKRGLRFAVQSIPWHWFSYFYSGLAFILGVARHLLFSRPGRLTGGKSIREPSADRQVGSQADE